MIKRVGKIDEANDRHFNLVKAWYFKVLHDNCKVEHLASVILNHLGEYPSRLIESFSGLHLLKGDYIVIMKDGYCSGTMRYGDQSIHAFRLQDIFNSCAFLTLYKEILENLFEGYVEYGGGSIFEIDHMTNKCGLSAFQIGQAMLREGLIKYPRPDIKNDTYSCGISREGIKALHPDYFNGLASRALVTAGMVDDWVELGFAVGFAERDYQRTVDLGREMEAQGLIGLRITADTVWVKPTEMGMERYRQQNRGGFIK